ncbi:MAG: hypothetical protein QMB99_04330, partial [Paludibacteraceae bacterium]
CKVIERRDFIARLQASNEHNVQLSITSRIIHYTTAKRPDTFLVATSFKAWVCRKKDLRALA